MFPTFTKSQRSASKKICIFYKQPVLLPKTQKMAKQYNEISPEFQTFIENQKVFFVATAPQEGHINLSPKGMDSLRVLNAHKIVWLNLTGSGNETAAHLLEDSRMTIMFCAFEGKPLILRLYGNAKALHPRDPEWNDYIHLFPNFVGSRQLLLMDIELVQTSCGYSIPFMPFEKERNGLEKWSAKKGEEGIKEYWQEKNTVTIDGKPTGI